MNTSNSAAERSDVLQLPKALSAPLGEAMACRGGEVIVTNEEGSGRIYVANGHIAWVVSSNIGYRLSDALMTFAGLEREVLRTVVEDCQRDRTHFGQTLRQRGLVDSAQLRTSLLWHNRTHLAGLLELRDPLQVRFLPTVRPRSEPDLLFALDELLTTSPSAPPQGGRTAEQERALGEVYRRNATLPPASSKVRAPTSSRRDTQDASSGANPDSPGQEDGGTEFFETMANIQSSLDEIMELEGAIAAALVDHGNGLTLGTAGRDDTFNIEVAAFGNTDVVRSKMRVMTALALNSSIEDILITLSDQYHLIRLLPGHDTLFLYVAINRERGNLGLARRTLQEVERRLHI